MKDTSDQDRGELSGVLNDVFLSGLPGFLGLPAHPHWSRSLQHVHASVSRSLPFGRCILFPEYFSNTPTVQSFLFAVYVRKFREYPLRTV